MGDKHRECLVDKILTLKIERSF